MVVCNISQHFNHRLVISSSGILKEMKYQNCTNRKDDHIGLTAKPRALSWLSVLFTVHLLLSS